MRLKLHFPASWITRHLNARLSDVLVSKGPTGEPELLLWVRWELPMPAGWKSWIEESMRFELPSGHTPRQHALRRGQSAAGWPVSIAEYEILDDKGRVVEMRIGVFYRLVDHGAELVLRIRNRARYEEQKSELTRFLLSGEADWTQTQAPSLFHLRSEGMTLSSFIATDPDDKNSRSSGS